MSKHFARMLKALHPLIEEVRRAATPPPSLPSDKEGLIIAKLKIETIRRQLADASAAARADEERRQHAYWQLWRSIRPSAGQVIPPTVLDPSVPEHVTLALIVVGDYDAAREDPGAYADCLYRPVSDLPYPRNAIRRCCEFLIGIADGDPASFDGDHEQLAKERDALGLALFSLDYFLDLPASEVPRKKLENLALEHTYVARSRQTVKPRPGDVVIRTGSGLTESVSEVIGVGDNDQWMIFTSSGASMQVVPSAEPGKWDEVHVVAPAEASWLALTPPSGTPTWGL